MFSFLSYFQSSNLNNLSLRNIEYMKNNKIINIKKTPNTSSQDKSKKFKKLSNIRVANLLDNLRLVGNLANKRYYEYSEKEKNEILKAIRQEYNSMKAAWDKAGQKKESVKRKGFWERVNGNE